MMKHLTEDHSLFGIDVIDELVEEYMQIDTDSVEIPNFVELPDVIDCFNFVTDVSDSIFSTPWIILLTLLTSCDEDLECSCCLRIRYAYLDDHQHFPVIIANNLEVVKKEDTKLLAVGIIYPISDNQWANPVQVVLKKFGMTMMKNRHDELVPTRIKNSWRVCIDY
ncbi:hypothetical protein CR513_03898, partial [Mucuna pruriens]